MTGIITNRNRKITALLIALTMLFSVMLSLTAFAGADSKEQKVVRIGYVSAENYEEGGEGEYKRGFGYEYFQKISYITGWKYEYVYGSFAECYQKLVDGEIDLFGNVSYTPERAELFFYSDYPQGKDTYWLYAANHRKDLLTNDLTNLNGIRIGVTKNSFQEGLLNEWLENNNLTAEVIGCNGFDEMMTRSDDKDLDAFVAPDLSVNYGYDIITGVGFSDYYFAVSKQRPDILGELNAALYEIQNSNSDYNSLLVSKYYYKMASGISMNVEEKEWLANNNNTIRIGALKNYLPFIGEDANGEVVGLITTVIDSLKRDYDVNIELITYPDIFSMKDDLENDRIDLVGPVVGDLYLAEQLDYVLTDSFVETTPVIIFKGDNYLESLKSIATTEESIFTRSVIEVMFPDAEIIECKSGEDGLRAVATGKAGCMIIPSARINIVRSYPDMKGLSVAEMTNRTDINFFTTKEKRRAASIVNKAILHTSVSLIGIVLAEYSGIENKMSAAEFIRQNAGYVVVILIIIISSLSFLIIKLIKSRKQLDKALTEATELNATVEESNKKLTDQLEIIDSVAQVFVCLYYIDLEKQTYVKVGPTAEFVEKVIGHCGNIKEGFEKMYKYLVDDSYDVTMREFTDLSTLDERLKNHKWISCQFLGRTGWAEGFFITADRDENGSIKRVIWGIKSITEQKQMELEYQRELEIKAEEARNANEAKSKFLFNMSHDIRTPMNAIIGYSQLIKRELTDPKLLDYEEKIEHSSNLLMSIINNVLDMARIESGKAEVDLQYVYAGNVTDEIMSIFQAEAREKGIELILTKNVTHHHLLLDETKVKEVLLNLLSNAVKYTPEGGRIDFSITELPSNRDGYALFQTVVKDTGIGMSKEYLPQLFDSFTRERNTTTSKVSGTGLGMPIVKKLVDLMGGTIEVESELGKGTTFTLTLEHRLADEAYYDQKAVTSDAEKKEIMQDKKILLAEDNDLNAEIAMIILEERGFVIDRANDGIECVAMMEGMPAGTYDIILMDIQMPNMDGYKATKSIRQLSDSDKANIPIIAMTANAFEEDKMNAINAGMNGHIAKPIDVNKLEDVILSVLEGKED